MEVLIAIVSRRQPRQTIIVEDPIHPKRALLHVNDNASVC